MGMEEKTIGVSPVGCAVFAYKYLDIDWQEAAHGRAPAVATAIKRLWPDRLVFSYQGDGDMACIGTAESIHEKAFENVPPGKQGFVAWFVWLQSTLSILPEQQYLLVS